MEMKALAKRNQRILNRAQAAVTKVIPTTRYLVFDSYHKFFFVLLNAGLICTIDIPYKGYSVICYLTLNISD